MKIFAWFTDSAFSKGNKVFAGNMYIDIIASDDEIIQNGLASPADIDIIYPNKYTRKLTTDDNDDGTTYRIITDENANIVSIYNFEPGQFKKAHVNFMNSGDLAFKTVGALKIESNLNGIETLNEQYKKNLEVYKNKYQITDEALVGNAQTVDAIKSTIDPFKIFEANNDDNPSNNYDDGIFAEGEFTYDDYLYRFNKLINMIPYISENEYNALEEDEKSLYKPLIKLNEDSSDATPIIGYTNHGNLSNVLEVYASSDFEEVRKHHESDAYFGTLDQFEYLISNGPAAIKDLSSVSAILNNNTPEDNYKVICNDPSANLYDDYQRYLSYASGYCVPKETITNNVGKIDPNTKVKVYAGSVNDPTSTYELIQVSEIGSIDFFLYMPEEVNSTYQNASLSLSIGGTATQVPFEVDDLGFMIYDEMIFEKSDPIVNTDVETGDVISLKFVNKDNEPVDSFFRVVSTDNNNATLMLLSQRDIRTAYVKQEASDLPIENVKGIDIMSIDKSGIPDYLNSLYESIDNLDYKDSIVKQKYKQDVYELKALYISNYNFYGTPGGPYEVGDFDDCDYIITLRNFPYSSSQTIESIKYGVKYAFSNDKEIEGYFRLPSIKDLASCAGLSGSKVIDVEDIIKIIYGSAEIPSNVEFYPSWTSDAIYKSDALKEENLIKISYVLSNFAGGIHDISTLETVTSTGVNFIGLPSTVLNNDEEKAQALNELKATRFNINPVFIIPLSELSEIKPVFKKGDAFSGVVDELIDYKNIDFYYISYGGKYDQPYMMAIRSNSSDIKETLYDNEININFYGNFYRTENIADELQQLFENFNEHLDTSVPQIFTIEIPYKNVSDQEAFFNFLSNSEIVNENSQFYIYLLGDCYVDFSEYSLPDNVNTSLLVTPTKFVELLKSNGLSSDDVAMGFGDQSLSEADESIYTNVVGQPKIVDFNKNGIAKTGESLNNNAKFLVASSVYLDAISLFNDYFRDNPNVSHVANLNVFIFDAGDDYAAIDDALNALSIKYSNHINYSIYGVDMDNVLKNLTNNIISTLNDVDKISLPIIKKLK